MNGAVASLIIVVYFVIFSFTSQITCQNIQWSSSNNCYTLTSPLNGLRKGKYTPNTCLIQKQPFADMLQNRCS